MVWNSGTEVRAEKASGSGLAPPKAGGLEISSAFDYARVSSVEESDEAGRAVGPQYGGEWGENRKPHQAIAQVHAAVAAQHLIAIDCVRRAIEFKQQAREHKAEHDRTREQLPAAEAEAERAGRELEALREQAREADLPEPSQDDDRSRRRMALEFVVALLFLVPDLFLTAPAFDRFNLSDEPVIGDLTWTDERHVAALGVVVGLLVLAHLLGVRLVTAAWRAGVRLRADRAQSESGSAVPTRATSGQEPTPAVAA